MKDKAVVGVGGAGAGFLIGNLTPHEAIEITKWIETALGPVGFVSFLFNIAQAVALYLTVVIYNARDDQKRSDMKEAFTAMNNLVEKMHDAMDKYTAAISDFRVTVASKGIILGTPEKAS